KQDVCVSRGAPCHRRKGRLIPVIGRRAGTTGAKRTTGGFRDDGWANSPGKSGCKEESDPDGAEPGAARGAKSAAVEKISRGLNGPGHFVKAARKMERRRTTAQGWPATMSRSYWTPSHGRTHDGHPDSITIAGRRRHEVVAGFDRPAGSK